MNLNALTLLHCFLNKEIPYKTLKKVAEILQQNNENLYQKSCDEFIQYGCTHTEALIIAKTLLDTSLLEKELSLAEKNNVIIVSIFDNQYPLLLKNIYSPPLIIYTQGTLHNNQEELSLSVVGSRDATEYGYKALDQLLPDLLANNFTIISGGARGIDAYAHQLTLNHHQKTIAVLGSGLLRPYPLSNKKLFNSIVNNNGCIISSFNLEAEALAWRFPARNRIIAGLSKGTFVVQASIKSGALITAQYALKENRNVYALPGLFNDFLSSGSHMLIQEGAQLVISSKDFLKDYDIKNNLDNNKIFLTPAVQTISKKIYSSDQINLQQKNPNLADLCKNPMSLEELYFLTGKSKVDLQNELFLLQLEGLIIQDFTGLWIKIA